jgi:hypothetical protein
MALTLPSEWRASGEAPSGSPVAVEVSVGQAQAAAGLDGWAWLQDEAVTRQRQGAYDSAHCRTQRPTRPEPKALPPPDGQDLGRCFEKHPLNRPRWHRQDWDMLHDLQELEDVRRGDEPGPHLLKQSVEFIL